MDLVDRLGFLLLVTVPKVETHHNEEDAVAVVLFHVCVLADAVEFVKVVECTAM